jgi:nucleotide-binding universal stress UspA family protein
MFKKILCPTDFSEASYKAVEIAVQLANTHMTEIVLLYVEPVLSRTSPADEVTLYHEASNRAEVLRSLSDVVEARIPVHLASETLFRQGKAGVEIIRAAEDCGADLIVLAAHGGGTGDEALGENTSYVLREATCPVLVLRSKEHPHAAVTPGSREPEMTFRPAFETVHANSHALYLDGD